MSGASLDTVLPRHVDPRKFAQQGIAVKGQFALKALSRLCPLLAADEGDVRADLTFGVDEQHTRYVTGSIEVSVQMVCQRCLEPAPQDVKATLNLGMVWSDEQAAQLPKSWDPWIVGEGQIDLYEIIEDELMLSLPIVAYHEEMCVPEALYTSGEQLKSEAVDNEEKPNPFQVLEQLKGSLGETPEKD